MAKTSEAHSRVEILVLSTLARLPMHGYEIKLELRYRHVQWWARLEHGHLYAALERLEKKGFIRHVEPSEKGRGSRPRGPGRERRVFAITAAGKRYLSRALHEVGSFPVATYFDLDLFLASSYVLDREEAIGILEERRQGLVAQRTEAEGLRRSMENLVPLAGLLVMEHRIQHLVTELAFLDRVIEAFRTSTRWGSFLGQERISDFISRTGVGLEPDSRRSQSSR